MTSVHQRLYDSRAIGTRGQANSDHMNLVPRRLVPVVIDASISEDHLAGFAVWCGAGLIVGGLSLAIAGPWWAASVLGVVSTAPVLTLLARRGRRTRRVLRALPDVIDAMSRSLRSGASFYQALNESTAGAESEVANELSQVVASIDRGKTCSQALMDWAERMPHPEVRIVAAVLAMTSENETASTQALDGVQQSLRDRFDLQGDLHSHAAQATSSMRAMVLLPIGFLLLDGLGERRTLQYLFTTVVGRVCLLLGLCLNIIGAVWMRHTVQRRVVT